MNDKIKNIAVFVLGVSFGAIVTRQCIKKKYDDIAREEINSVKNTFSGKNKISEHKNNELSDDNTEALKLERNDYSEYSKIASAYKNDDSEHEKEPYVISPDRFGEKKDYDTVILTYYADKVLANESGDPMMDYSDIIGENSLNRFGEYEDDSVFVRNDALKCDFEILLDVNKYFSWE